MAGALALATALGAGPAWALQPLDEFLASARTQSFDQREAAAVTEQREAERSQAWSRIAPSFTATGSYTRNQYEALARVPSATGGAPTVVTITPKDQLEGTLTVTLPLVDVGAWTRIGAAGAAADAAGARALSTGDAVEKNVTRSYYQVVAADATIAAANKALEAAADNLKVTTSRREAGAASDLDVERARASVERSRQSLAIAMQQSAVGRQSLGTLAGLAPTAGEAPLPEPVTTEPGPVDAAAIASLPEVRAAELDKIAAERSATAAWAAFAPTASAHATERFTNATGFGGNEASWSVGVTAQWTLDAGTYYGAKVAAAQGAAASVRSERARAAARDELVSAYEEVRSQIARSRAADAELQASARAAKLARERYEAGAATQLDVVEADRDAFQADVARVQAYADLAYARALLRIASGHGRLATEVAR